ncbi:MAG TPA: dTDP-4-dehydrorhamnose reductase [Gemmatimonadaceae bacterium]|nr:dTDP-4-dehydrorhamnose reductase [Gemmatimonadaceae bacterium]
MTDAWATAARAQRSGRAVLLFGGGGQVGRQLRVALAPLGTVIPLTRAEADLRDPDAMRAVIERVRPLVIVNAAALTNVDQAERDPGLANAVNTIAPGIMADAARRVGALFVHYSTDYVFDGAIQVPYDEDAQPNPINTYGRSKLAGEQRVAEADGSHMIIRTSWVYSVTGAGFVASLLRDLPGKQIVRIVADQVGSPTWSRSLASATAALVQAAVRDDEVALNSSDWGVYHLGGSGEGSRVEIAEALIDALASRLAGDRPTIVPISASVFGALAPRPHYSALSNLRARKRFGISLQPWRTELHRMVAEEYR